jgi:hypothetical protein
MSAAIGPAQGARASGSDDRRTRSAPSDGSRRPLAGPALIVICVIHLACAPLFYGTGWDAILADGVINAVETTPEDPERSSTFWYVVAGLALVPFGFLVWWVERRLGRLPAALGWLLIGFVAITVLMVPTGGFWLFLVPAGVVLLRARSAGRPAPS